MYKGITKLDITELFVRDLNVKGTRGHTAKLETELYEGLQEIFLLTEGDRALKQLGSGYGGCI